MTQGKRERTGFIVAITVMLNLSIICVCLAVFIVRWNVTNEWYENVEYEWDDDKDRYDVYVEDLGHFYMPTDKATLIFLPDDSTQNCAIIEKRETIFGKLERYELVKFYINCGYQETE